MCFGSSHQHSVQPAVWSSHCFPQQLHMYKHNKTLRKTLILSTLKFKGPVDKSDECQNIISQESELEFRPDIVSKAKIIFTSIQNITLNLTHEIIITVKIKLRQLFTKVCCSKALHFIKWQFCNTSKLG